MKLKRLENETELDWNCRQISANLKAANRNISIAFIFLALSVVNIVIIVLLLLNR